jgi:hypothetical protein
MAGEESGTERMGNPGTGPSCLRTGRALASAAMAFAREYEAVHASHDGVPMLTSRLPIWSGPPGRES